MFLYILVLVLSLTVGECHGFRYIEGYVQKVNPAKTPQVVGALLDVECQEDFVKNLIISVRALLPVEPLVAEVEKRNRLKILSNFLEHLEREGSQVRTELPALSYTYLLIGYLVG